MHTTPPSLAAYGLWASRFHVFTESDLRWVSGARELEVRDALRQMTGAEAVRHEGEHFVAKRGVLSPIRKIYPALRAVSAPVVAERSLAFAEKVVARSDGDHSKTPGLRRFALYCLDAVSRRDAPIPGSNRSDTPEAARRDTLRARTVAARRDLLDRRPATSRAIRALRRVSKPCRHLPPLPGDAKALSGAREALAARFGPAGRFLSSGGIGSWQAHVLCDARLTLAGEVDPFWRGDIWLRPPGPPDARTGALDIARTYGRAVSASTKKGERVWKVQPNGDVSVTEAGVRLVGWVVEIGDAVSWSTDGHYPLLPIEVPAGRDPRDVFLAAASPGLGSSGRPG